MPKSLKQMDIKGAYIQDIYMALEEELVNMLIKRLSDKTVTELTTDTVFKWQMEKMQQLGMMDIQTVSDIASKSIKISKQQLKELITNQGYDFLQESNKEFANLMSVNVKEWTQLDQILNQYFESRWMELDNFVNQTLLTTNYRLNMFYQTYTDVLNNTVAKVLTGFQTPQKAFKSSIYEMVDKGIMSTFKDKAGRDWSLERYVRTVIKSTAHHVYNDMRIVRGHDYDIVTALMSSHAAARKACAPIQGGWVLTVRTDEAPLEFQHIKSIYDYGYKTPEGTQGINCNHRLYVAVPGINENNIPKPPSPEKAMQNAEIVAKQRRLEVSIRNAKKRLNAAEQLGEQSDVEHFKSLIRQRQGALRQYIDDHKELLHRDYSREAVYS